MKPITLEQAKSLQPGQTLHHMTARNADKTPVRWRVNGRPKTWKRSPNRVKVPVKNGLWGYGYITEASLQQFSLTDTEEDAVGFPAWPEDVPH